MTTPEQWRPVVDYEGLYEVSDQGRVKSLPRLDRLGRNVIERIMRQKLVGSKLKPSSRRFAVVLHRNGVSETKYVHVAMLESFIGLRPLGMVGCHVDDTSRNDLSNLKWDTVSGNNFDLVRNGRHARARRTHCKRFGHELTVENVYINPSSGARCCRRCIKIDGQNRWLKLASKLSTG